MCFKDVYDSSNDKQVLQATYNGFDETSFGNRRIDYIFYDQFSVEEASHVALKTKWGGWASDHHPVKAILNH